jgi:hypothetical protein
MDFTKERAMSRSSTAGSNPRNLSEARKTIEVRVRRASRFIETMSRYPRYGLPCPSVPSAFVGGRIFASGILRPEELARDLKST